MSNENQNSMIASALADTYSCLFYADMDTETYTSYKNELSRVARFVPVTGDLRTAFKTFEDHLCQPEFSEQIHEFANVENLKIRLKKVNSVSMEFGGSVLPWCVVSFVVCSRHEDGSVHNFIMGISDRTKEKRAEQEQAKVLKANIDANVSKTRMLQNMTHEIRTPLNAMYGFSQLLCLPDGCVSEVEKAQYLSYITNSFNMLTMLIDDVLDLADAEHGNYRTIDETVSINDVCRTALQMAEIRKADAVNMYLTTDVADDYTIQSDGRRIQQVLINLLTNACKHTQQGEIELKVSTTENPGRLTLSVRDTGEGIPAEMTHTIFKRYAKANAMVQGSGLGLNICSIIAEKLNAEISLDESYRTGARFVFIL